MPDQPVPAPSVAETLRELAKCCAEDPDMACRLSDEEKAACEAGARALEERETISVQDREDAVEAAMDAGMMRYSLELSEANGDISRARMVTEREALAVQLSQVRRLLRLPPTGDVQ